MELTHLPEPPSGIPQPAASLPVNILPRSMLPRYLVFIAHHQFERVRYFFWPCALANDIVLQRSD